LFIFIEIDFTIIDVKISLKVHLIKIMLQYHKTTNKNRYNIADKIVNTYSGFFEL